MKGKTVDSTSKIYVVRAGSIGMPLAALLSVQGAAVTAVQTSLAGMKPANGGVTIELAEGRSVSTTLEMVSLSEVKKRMMASLIKEVKLKRRLTKLSNY
jgi:hypothetical protein